MSLIINPFVFAAPGGGGGGPYRYIRLNITATPSMLRVALSNVEYRESIGGSDATGSGTASASNFANNSSTFNAAKAFDNNTSTRWLTDEAVAGVAWLKYDFGVGNAVDVVQYVILAPPEEAATRTPEDWTLEGSNDDSAWDVLHTVTGEVGWAAREARTFVV